MELNISHEYVTEYPFIEGKTIVRIIEVGGVRNSAGEPEVYRAILKGFAKNGALFFDGEVQRPNGKFAALNQNKHWSKLSQLRQAISGMIPQYKADIAALT